jgi:REP element-mobilizing transposase RayT
MVPLPEWINLPRRKSPRHPQLDYTLGGYYHIIICTAERRPMLGRPAGDEIALNGIGRVVEAELVRLASHYDGLTVDCYRVMHDHVHVLLFLDGLNANRPDVRRVVQRLKSTVAMRYLRWRKSTGALHLPDVLWQRSFYDAYIKHEDQLYNVRQYILYNALALSLKSK